jgi:hypothetical protein
MQDQKQGSKMALVFLFISFDNHQAPEHPAIEDL